MLINLLKNSRKCEYTCAFVSGEGKNYLRMETDLIFGLAGVIIWHLN